MSRQLHHFLVNLQGFPRVSGDEPDVIGSPVFRS